MALPFLLFRLNFGQRTINNGMRGFWRGVGIWSMMQASVFLVYFGLKLWAQVRLTFRKSKLVFESLNQWRAAIKTSRNHSWRMFVSDSRKRKSCEDNFRFQLKFLNEITQILNLETLLSSSSGHSSEIYENATLDLKNLKNEDTPNCPVFHQYNLLYYSVFKNLNYGLFRHRAEQGLKFWL